jgi:cation transport ATPase
MEVLCGNKKLMNFYKVLDNYPELSKNINYLEQEGKTVVILAVN